MRAPLLRLLRQQLLLITSLAAVVVLHRRVTGRTLKGLADTPTLVDLLTFVVVAVALTWASRQLVRADPAAPALGLQLTWRQVALAAVGFVVAAALNSLPWAVPLLQGDVVRVADVVPVSARALLLGLSVGLLNALFEEATSRGAPLALLAAWPAWRAAAVSALCFALMHGINESLSLVRLAYLWALGVVLATCWLRTRHVWLGTGVHAGWFWATLVPSGRTASGALLTMRGNLQTPLALADAALVAVALGCLWWLRARPPVSPSPLPAR